MDHPGRAGAAHAAVAGTDDYGSPAYRWYVVFVFMLIYACHSLDRGIPNIVVEPVKREFGLSDAEIGLFTGVSFGVAFALAALPMGYLADRTHRRNMLAAVMLLWSGCTALGGIVRSYALLLLSRVGVGIGEAGAAPLALPMISDIFPPHRRAFAIGVFYMSVPIGAVVANVAGGWVAEHFGWRAAFLMAGAPGLLLAFVLLATVREPRRGGADGAEPNEDGEPARIGAVLRFVVSQPGLLCLMGGCATMGLITITSHAWIGSFFIRVHGLNLTEVGLLLGAGNAVGGISAYLIIGALADRLGARDPRWPLRLVWLGALAAIAMALAMLFTPAIAVSVAAYFLVILLTNGYPPPTYAVLMGATPAQMRGTIMSLLQLITNLVGFSVGPVVIGVLSDRFGGGTAIRYALASALVFNLVAVALFLAASRLLYGANRAVADRTPS
ncbi:MAG: spinster family MFS transporter [Gammaproteobacteria bacterium]